MAESRTSIATESLLRTASAVRRVIVEHLQPSVDGGRFAIKRTVGETVTVTVDMFADGHDQIAGVLKYRPRPGRSRPVRPGTTDAPPDADALADGWQEVPLQALGNDAWTASFVVTSLGTYQYTVEGWIDRFSSWRHALIAKSEAGQDVASELLEGAQLVEAAAGRVPGETGLHLLDIADRLRGDEPQAGRVLRARDEVLLATMTQHPDRSTASAYPVVLEVIVDPIGARFSAWYEMFPRSATADPSRSGTFREAEALLPAIADMGFDVVYLPPVHPIGRTHRKGRNNALVADPSDPGSPWAIGAAEGGHTAIEPGLGTIDDFDRFVAVAGRLGLQVALDIAFQASPDHPWVAEHPEWFRHRPDGSIKYAENPPKKYQDIYPLDFDSRAWPALWEALHQVFVFWIGHGVTIFRVDNPHTKSFRFWEWVIGELRREHPEVILLAEAFTRPKVMRYLAKAGFSQSYTYFTWRNSAAELREYLTELTTTELQEYMRPNFFANTPDILHEFLQTGGPPAFHLRLVLAATLGASYGIYSGYELYENRAVRPGSEEYLDSEKYQFKPRDWSGAAVMRELIARVNDIRRTRPALQHNATLTFHECDNPSLLCYSKRPPGPPALASNAGIPVPSPRGGTVLVVATTDVQWVQHGWVRFPIESVGLGSDEPYVIEDLLDGSTYTWRGAWNYVKLDPRERVAHIFVVRDA